MIKYLRFGEIPTDERSVNYFELRHKHGDHDYSHSDIPDDCKEAGVSVFEMSKDGLPVLSNMRLCTSLLSRCELHIYEVTGDKIGVGSDGEPLLVNVHILKSRRISAEKLQALVFKTLVSNFRTIERCEADCKQIGYSVELRVYRISDGAILDYYSVYGDYHANTDAYIRLPVRETYMFNDCRFSDPADTFDARIGFCKEGK